MKFSAGTRPCGSGPRHPPPPRSPRRSARGAVTVTVAGVAVAALTAGCHVPGTGSAKAGAAPLSPVTVAATPGVADAPLFLAKRDGLFARAGLRVTINSYPTAKAELAALRPARAGSTPAVDVAAMDYADGLYAESVDPDLLIVADGYDAAPNVMEVLALPGSHITLPSQLSGKRIGTPLPDELPYNQQIPYSLETLATQSVLLTDGVEPYRVTWVQLPSSSLLAALRNHQVDAILATEPLIFQAESQLGATEVLDSLSGQTADIPLSGYFSTRPFARAHPSALRAFRSALLAAQALAASGRAVRNVLASHLSTETADMVTLGVYPTSLNVSGIQQVANLMFNFNMVPEPLDVSAMIFR